MYHRSPLFTPLLLLLLTLVTGCAEDLETRGIENYAYDDGPWLTATSSPSTSVTISWLTAEPSATELLFGPEGDMLDVSLLEPRVVDGPDRRLHQVTLDNLSPDTRYCYLVDDPDFTGLVEGAQCFRTVPAIANSLRIGVLGDLQPDSPDLVTTNRFMAERLAEVDVDLWVQLGDMASTGGELESWRDVFSSLPLFAARVPLLSAIGNHDLDEDDGENWRSLFPYPFVTEDAHYYSVDLDTVHLVFLDNFDGANGPSEAQLEWLDTDLAAAEAAGQWIFAFMHLSILSTGTENMQFDQQEGFAPLFARYNVHGVFYGHDHMYEHYEYVYGSDGLVHSPEDADLIGRTVHYWLTGGGGAALEYTYGLLDQPISTVTREWYDVNSQQMVTRIWERRPWNPEILRDSTPEFDFMGAHYVHDCAVECYQDDAMRYGHDYGENTLNYMVIEVNGTDATVTAFYPDGSLVGEDWGRPQRVEFTLDE